MPAHPNGLAYAIKRARVDPAFLAKRVGVELAQLEVWIEGRELIPPAMARTLAAHLHTTAADILFALSYDRSELPPVWEEPE